MLPALATLLTIALFMGACAAGGGSETSSTTSTPATTAQQAPPKGVAAPAGHPLAQVTHKMSPEQVREILGEPDSRHSYPGAIWKNFIPYYYGADSGTRIEWGYAGQGRVVFTVNRYTQQQSVVRIDYDPNEDGK